MYYLKSVYPEIVLVDVLETTVGVRVMNDCFGAFFSSALQMLNIIGSCPNLIVYNYNIVKKQLYADDSTGLKASGFAVPDTILNIKKLGDEFMLVDDILIQPNKIYFNLHYLSDSWLNTQSLPMLRTQIINELLKNI